MFYNLRAAGEPNTFIITKFDKHYNVEASYLVTKADCACPSGSRPKCRHRTMLPIFLKANHVNDGWFLNFDTRQWIEPVNDDIEAHTVAPTTPEPEAEVHLPPSAPVAPASARQSRVVGAPSNRPLIVRGF